MKVMIFLNRAVGDPLLLDEPGKSAGRPAPEERAARRWS
jgi:hypothetical protein